MANHMNVRTIIKTSASVLGLLLISLSACISYSFYVSRKAEKCLTALQQLRLGSSTEEEALQALQPFQRFEVAGTATIDGKDYSRRVYLFKNDGLHLLGIFHPALFQVSLTFRDRVVFERSASFYQEPSHEVITRESIAGLSQNPNLAEYSSGMMVGVYDPPVRMDIFLDTRASAADRKAAYQFNLACFSSLHGCSSVYEILPGVKQQHAK